MYLIFLFPASAFMCSGVAMGTTMLVVIVQRFLFLLLIVEQKPVLLLSDAVIHATIENQQAVCDSYCCFLKGLFSPTSKSKSFA